MTGVRRPHSADVAAGLRYYRAQSGMPTKEIARRAGYSLAAVYAWLQGRNAPSKFQLRCVCEAMKCRVDDVLSYRIPVEYRATRVGPYTPGRAYESGWSFEEVRA